VVGSAIVNEIARIGAGTQLISQVTQFVKPLLDAAHKA